MSSMRLLVTLTVLGAFCLLPFGSVFAQSDEAYIKYRQKVMQSQGANMGAIGDIMKEQLPLGGNIAGHAEEIHSSAMLIASAFKKQVTEGMTDAKADLWKDYKEFEEKAGALEKASAHLASVAKGGDMAAVGDAVKAVGKACGDCHKEYRKAKEESYKNKMK
jgi:cytochrome c556